MTLLNKNVPLHIDHKGANKVSSPLYLDRAEIQGELLKLLVVFDRFCNENGLRYSLACGTLLGAVRHKGFIPWDDDVDLSMPRPDYERLLALGRAIPVGYQVVTSRNSSFAQPFAKFQNLRIRAQEAAYEGVWEEFLWLDIFPVDGIPESRPSQARFKSRVWRLRRRRLRLTVPPKGLGPRAIAKRLYCLIRSDAKSIEKLDSRIADLASSIDYRKARYVASLCDGFKGVVALLREEYEDVVGMEFEGRSFPVPSCWKSSLAQEYGDYSILPPKEQRLTHGTKAWYVDPDLKGCHGPANRKVAEGEECKL